MSELREISKDNLDEILILKFFGHQKSMEVKIKSLNFEVGL